MPDLVPVPWQPQFYLTPHTLAYFVAASNRLGSHLMFTDAWRSYQQQKGYWDARVAYLNGTGPYAPPASNPDTGQRNHMRGAAGDLVRTDAAAQAACRAVGLVRDADESWHWNDPNWPNMPIIPVNTSVAGGGATPILEGFLMALSDAEQADMKMKLDNLYAATFSGGPSMKDNGRSISASLGGIVQAIDTIRTTVTRPVQRTINGQIVNVSQIQDNADTNTMVRQLLAAQQAGAPAPTFDYDKLAAAIAATGIIAPTPQEIALAVAPAVAQEFSNRLEGKTA